MHVRSVKLYGRHSGDLKPMIEELGLVIDDTNPDAVISYGGDGTLLGAERDWPGVPKVAVRDSSRCLTCSHESNAVILKHLAEGKLRRNSFTKLEASSKGKTLVGINDIIIRNASINAGVRYLIWIDDIPYTDKEIVADGLVVATPFGSTAYYRSITHSTFRVGVGLAFNNTIEPINHLVLDENSTIRVEITRGPALLAADNNPEWVHLEKADEVRICKSDQCATILVYDRVRHPADEFIY